MINELIGNGSLDALVIALMGAVALDYLTGLLKAWHTHTLKSSVAKTGLIKKFALFAVVAMCGLIDYAIPVATGYGICKLCTACFVVSEAVSVLENAAELGVPVPETITKRLAQITEKEESNHED